MLISHAESEPARPSAARHYQCNGLHARVVAAACPRAKTIAPLVVHKAPTRRNRCSGRRSSCASLKCERDRPLSIDCAKKKSASHPLAIHCHNAIADAHSGSLGHTAGTNMVNAGLAVKGGSLRGVRCMVGQRRGQVSLKRGHLPSPHQRSYCHSSRPRAGLRERAAPSGQTLPRRRTMFEHDQRSPSSMSAGQTTRAVSEIRAPQEVLLPAPFLLPSLGAAHPPDERTLR